jgi:predicted GNAT family N-acyltransferase
MVLIEREKQILFLENLLTKLKNNHISVEEQRVLTDFYINYMFSNENNQRDEEKIKKYMSLGWYIYEILNK